MQAAEGDLPLISDDGKYHLQIVMYQWQFNVFNLQEDESLLDAIEKGNQIASSGPEGIVGPFSTGTEIVFEVYSRDVQHGFSINTLEIALATNRPEPGEFLGKKISVSTVLPSEPALLEAYCHIFCGLGHPDEKMSFQVGGDIAESDSLELPVLVFPLVFTLITMVYITRKQLT